MKKGMILFLLLFSVLLAACGASNTSITIDETETTQPVAAPEQSIAVCTAQSAESVDYAQPGDWITGATQGYAVTMIEYSDFQ